MSANKIPRNSPCPCGSGRKFNPLIAAKHEAGHAVVGVALGGNIDWLEIDKREFRGRTEFREPPIGPTDWLGNVIISLAGFAGERIDNKTSGRVFLRKVRQVLIGDKTSQVFHAYFPIHIGDDLDCCIFGPRPPACKYDYGLTTFDKSFFVSSPSLEAETALEQFLDGGLRSAWNILRENRQVHTELSKRLLVAGTCKGTDIADLTVAIKAFTAAVGGGAAAA
jgi:hypothetical protein